MKEPIRNASMQRRAPAVALLAAGALFFLTALPLRAAEKTITLIDAVAGTSTSRAIQPLGYGSLDSIGFQASYPSGATVTLESSVTGVVWNAGAATWDATGKILTAPVIGPMLYRAKVTANPAAIVHTGAGLSDISSGGTYSGAAVVFTVEITATGTPDTFRWRKGLGTWTTGVAITGSAQTLSDGVTVTFTATTGHTLSDSWALTFSAVSVWATATGSVELVLQ